MTGRRRALGIALIGAGAVLLAAALALVGRDLVEERRAGVQARQALEQIQDQLPSPAPESGGEDAAPAGETEVPNYILDPEREMPRVEVDGRTYIGVIQIPALGLALPVIGQWSYPDLRAAPCRYSGSAYEGGFVIAGHNYSTHFGPLNDVQAGAQVYFTDMEGNQFTYTVEAVEVLQPTAVEDMVSGQWDLTLFTCTVGGQARTAVRCVRTGPVIS